MPVQDEGNRVLEGLDQCTVFYVRVPSVTGVVKLREDSVPDEMRRSMPKELFSLEARVFGREALRVPGKLLNRIRNRLTRLGTPFLSGFLVAKEHEDEARVFIEEAAAEYDAWAMPFLDKIDPLVEAQCQKFPAWAEMIRRAAPTRDEVARKLTFRKSSFQVRSGSEKDAEELTAELESLPKQIAREFSTLVEANWAEMNSDKASQRFRRTLNDIRRKAKSLSYLHPKLRDLVDLIDQVLERIPAVGVITGADYALLRGLRQMLLDPSEILGEQRVLVAQVKTGSPIVGPESSSVTRSTQSAQNSKSQPTEPRPITADEDPQTPHEQPPQADASETEQWVI